MIRWNDGILQNTVEQKTKRLLEGCALHVMNRAKIAVPVLTGNLKRSIQYAPKPPAKGYVHVGTNVEYAPPIEFGHRTKSGSHVSARPFLRPALDSLNQRVVNRIINRIK